MKKEGGRGDVGCVVEGGVGIGGQNARNVNATATKRKKKSNNDLKKKERGDDDDATSPCNQSPSR